MKIMDYMAQKAQDNKTVRFKNYKIKRKEGVTEISKKGKPTYTIVDFGVK